MNFSPDAGPVLMERDTSGGTVLALVRTPYVAVRVRFGSRTYAERDDFTHTHPLKIEI